MTDINAVIERGRKRYGTAEFDQASQLCIDAIQDPSAREQFVAAVARNAEGEDIVYRRANELRSKALGREGPKSDAREQRIASINPRSPMYDTVKDDEWNAAFDAKYGAKARKRR
jgi:hypothetical protein